MYLIALPAHRPTRKNIKHEISTLVIFASIVSVAFPSAINISKVSGKPDARSLGDKLYRTALVRGLYIFADRRSRSWPNLHVADIFLARMYILARADFPRSERTQHTRYTHTHTDVRAVTRWIISDWTDSLLYPSGKKKNISMVNIIAVCRRNDCDTWNYESVNRELVDCHRV